MNAFLLIHIIGGALTMIIILLSLVAAIIKKGPVKMIITSLKWSAIFQTLTGVLVLFFVPGVSVAAVCYKGLGLVVITIILQFLVRLRLNYGQKNLKPF
jgi:hypothetical protein